MSTTVLLITYGIGFLTVIAFPFIMCYGKTDILHMVVVILGSVIFQAPAVWDLFDGNTLRGIVLTVLYFSIFFGFTHIVGVIYWKKRGVK